MGRTAEDSENGPVARPKLHASPSFITIMEREQSKRKDLVERQVEMTDRSVAVNNGNRV